MKLKDLKVLGEKARFYVAGTLYFDGKFEDFAKTETYDSQQGEASILKGDEQ